MPPRTIDNLGIGTSKQWAETQEYIGSDKLIQESRAVRPQTEIEVTLPSFASELDSLLHSQPTQRPWASFVMPDKYHAQQKRLFTYHLIPSIGSEEKKDALCQKLSAKIRSLANRRQQNEPGEQEKRKQQQWKEAKELEEAEKEKEILISLLQALEFYDKLLVAFNSRRSQYQKG